VTPIAPANRIFSFGVFEADVRSAELRKKGLRVKLQRQPFQILSLLLEHAGELVTRNELRRALWPSGTFVDFEHSLNTSIMKLREALGDEAETPRYIETLSRRGYRFIAPVEPGPACEAPREPAGKMQPLQAIGAVRTPPLTIESIAVLPFENLARDKELEYFADGMTEALITNLGKSGALRVVSRTTMRHLKATTKTVPEIGRELGVDALVEGTVLRFGKRMRVTANLLHAPTDRHLWAESYESELKDVLVLQDEMARGIAAQVKAALASEAPLQIPNPRIVNPESYESYLKGNYARRRSAAGLLTGIQHFREAIAKDANCVQAQVGLALSYIQMGYGYGPLPPRQAFDEAREATLEALRLDAALGEAHACLGFLKGFSQWDWQGGESDFRRALELSPSSAEVYRLHSWYLSAVGKHEEAIAESLRARELDPASVVAGYAVLGACWWARRYERAAAETEKLERIDPTFPGIHRILGGVYVETGAYEQAIQHYQREMELCGEERSTWALAYLGYAHGRSGSRAEALHVLGELQLRSKRQYVLPYLLAMVQMSLGNTEQALQGLEQAFREQAGMLAFLGCDPFFDALRSHPRFQNLLRRMNLPR
jgi:TolB-like protein/tetratricopeptide (TPR) repeat protein